MGRYALRDFSLLTAREFSVVFTSDLQCSGVKISAGLCKKRARVWWSPLMYQRHLKLLSETNICWSVV